MSLPFDTSRCLGEQHDYVCPERNSCQRYLSHLSRSNVGVRVPYAQVMRMPEDLECAYKIDKEI